MSHVTHGVEHVSWWCSNLVGIQMTQNWRGSRSKSSPEALSRPIWPPASGKWGSAKPLFADTWGLAVTIPDPRGATCTICPITSSFDHTFPLTILCPPKAYNRAQTLKGVSTIIGKHCFDLFSPFRLRLISDCLKTLGRWSLYVWSLMILSWNFRAHQWAVKKSEHARAVQTFVRQHVLSSLVFFILISNELLLFWNFKHTFFMWSLMILKWRFMNDPRNRGPSSHQPLCGFRFKWIKKPLDFPPRIWNPWFDQFEVKLILCPYLAS